MPFGMPWHAGCCWIFLDGSWNTKTRPTYATPQLGRSVFWEWIQHHLLRRLLRRILRRWHRFCHVLVGSGALVLSAFGYTAGDVVMRLIGSPGISDMLLATSALAVGLVLDVDSAGVKSGLAHPGRIRQVGHFGD